jgi:hypothetical protein
MKTVYQLIQEERERQNPHEGKEYRKIRIRTHSGERETYTDVSRLVIKGIGIMEFEYMDLNQKIRVFKNPGFLEHSEEKLDLL